MIRIVLDTNTLISGTFWTGASYHAIILIKKVNAKIIVSEEILKEYDRILHSDEIINKPAYSNERARSITKLIQTSTLVEPNKNIKIVKEDPNDDKFIQAADAGNADYIISRDNHLLKIKKYKNIKIITPEEFLKEIKTQ